MILLKAALKSPLDLAEFVLFLKLNFEPFLKILIPTFVQYFSSKILKIVSKRSDRLNREIGVQKKCKLVILFFFSDILSDDFIWSLSRTDSIACGTISDRTSAKFRQIRGGNRNQF